MNHEQFFQQPGWNERKSQFKNVVAIILFLLNGQNKKVVPFLESFTSLSFSPKLQLLQSHCCTHFILMEKNY